MTFDEHFAEEIATMKQYIIDEKHLSGITLTMEDGFTFRLSIPKNKLERIRANAPMERIRKRMGIQE